MHREILPADNAVVWLEAQTMVLHGSIHFKNVVALQHAGSQLIHTHNILAIDLSKLDSSDSSGLALLISWARQAQKQHQCLVFKGAPDFLRSIASVYELDTLKGLSWED